ncbi:MAG: hypothetical protein V1856_02045 [Candidatus Liptonbacteria bacterium]
MPKKSAGRRGSVKKKITKRPVGKAVKKSTKKAAVKKVAVKTVPAKPVGTVTHFYSHLRVAIVKFKQPVRVGAKIRLEGATTRFEDKIVSMQYDHKPIKIAPKGKEVGIKVKKKTREGDAVFLVK